MATAQDERDRQYDTLSAQVQTCNAAISDSTQQLSEKLHEAHAAHEAQLAQVTSDSQKTTADLTDKLRATRTELQDAIAAMTDNLDEKLGETRGRIMDELNEIHDATNKNSQQEYAGIQTSLTNIRSGHASMVDELKKEMRAKFDASHKADQRQRHATDEQFEAITERLKQMDTEVHGTLDTLLGDVVRAFRMVCECCRRS